MEASKVILSEAEQRLLANADIILTKNEAMDKIVEMFGDLANLYKSNCEYLMPAFPHIFGVHPKISKGEKHKNLPWVIVDYPRVFDKQNGQLAIRCLFWWGNYFSIQLQVSGIYLLPVWMVAKTQPETMNWISGFTDDPWDFVLPDNTWKDFEKKPDNVNDMVLKMAKKIPIDQWESVVSRFTEDHKWLVTMLAKALGT